MTQSAVLDSYEVAVDIVVGYLEPGGVVAVGVGVQAAPADDGRVELALLEEERAGFCVQVGMGEILGVFRSYEF